MPPVDEFDATFERMTTPGGEVQGPAPLATPPESVADVPPAPATEPHYDDVLSMLRSQQREAVQGSMFAAARSQPDTRAKAIELSKKVHMPAAFVEKHYDAIAKAAEPDLDYDQLLEKNPGLSRWLENPDNAAVGRDDVDSLSKTEEAVRRLLPKKAGPLLDYGRAAETGWHNLSGSVGMLGVAYGLMSPEDAAEHVAAANRRARELRAGMPDFAKEYTAALDVESQNVNRAAQTFFKSASEMRKKGTYDALRLFAEGKATVGEALDFLGAALSRPRGLGYAAAENLANSLPAMVMGGVGSVGGMYAGGAGGAAVGGLPGFLAGVGIGGTAGFVGGSFAGTVPTEIGGWLNEQLAKKGVDTTDPAALATAFRDTKLMAQLRSEGERKGITTGAVDALFNAFAGKFFKAGLGASQGIRGTLQKGAAAATDVAVQAVGEGVSEGAGQFAAAKGDISKVDIGEMLNESVVSFGHSVGDTMVGASLRGALPKDTAQAAEQLSNDAQRAVESTQAAANLLQLAETVRESKTLQRLPEKVEELVQVIADGEPANVYFQSGDWDAYWTSKNLSPAKAAEQLMGDGGKAYMDAKETGVSLAVPMAKYVSQLVPTEHFEGLLPVTRADEGGMTFQEAREFRQSLPATMEELAKEATAASPVSPANLAEDSAGTTQAVSAEDSTKAIATSITEQLVAAGRPKAEAKAGAEVLARGLRALGDRTGIDPAELLRRYGLTVAGPEQTATGRSDGSPTLEQGFELPPIDIEDDYFAEPTGKGDRALPDIPSRIATMLEAPTRTMAIPEAVAAKNAKNHPDTRGQEKAILQQALYSPTEMFQVDPKKKPNYWALAKKDPEGNAYSVLEVSVDKGRLEVVSWFRMRDRSLKNRMEKARREGGQFLMSDGVASEVAVGRLSASPPGSPSVTQGGEGDQGSTFEQASPVGEHEEDLPIPELSAKRKAQAEKLGFDTSKVWYHGTPLGKFDAFQRSDRDGFAAFFTDDMAYADQYATNSYYTDSKVVEGGELPYRYAVYLKAQNTFDYENPQHVAKVAKQIRKEPSHKGKSAVLEAALSQGNWEVLERPDVVAAVKSLGFDSMFVTEDGRKNIGVFDANQIRSVDAKFDPKKADSENIYHQGDRAPAPPFFSKLQQTIEQKMGTSATVEQVRGLVKDIKEEERKWLGLEDFLKGKEKVSKAELLEFLRANALEIREVNLNENTGVSVGDTVYGVYTVEGEHMGSFTTRDAARKWVRAEVESDTSGSIDFNSFEIQDEEFNGQTLEDYEGPIGERSDGPTKFSKYQLPGGENYREVLFTLPHDEQRQIDNATNFTGSHWDEKNVLAHVRLNDRTDADGKKVLFVEEIQSDWHQEGRKKGYKGDAPQVVVREQQGSGFWEVLEGARYLSVFTDKESAETYAKWFEGDRASKPQKDTNAVPDAPFRKTWHEFALKRILRMAAEGGYDRVAWTTGEQQAERYDLSKQIDSMYFSRAKDGTYNIRLTQGADSGDVRTGVAESDLEGLIGKELAQKVVEKAGPKTKKLEGLDLKTGGEGMKGFYDKILVDFANKFGKKFGAKTSIARVSVGEKGRLDGERMVYTGPELTADEVRAIGANAGAMMASQFKDVASAIESGATTTAAVQRFGSVALAEDLGGSAEWVASPETEEAHALDITPALRDAALNEGFSLFQDGENDPRGRIRFGADGIRIELLAKADPSTFVHELGHFYLKVLGDIATAEDAPAAVKSDFEAVLKWLGTEPGKELTTEQHEQFARGFEAYLMEGKAPSSALREAFQNFKKWLLSVYRSVRNLGVELTPEVRGVFDRLVATEEEIAAAQADAGMTPLFGENPEAFGLTGKKLEAYQKATAEARRAAEDQLAGQMMKEIEERQTAEYQAERERVRFEIEAQVNAMPVYRAWSGIKDQTTPTGEPLPGAMRLSTEGVREVFGFKAIPENIRALGLTSADGVHPDIAAESYGFPSGKAMLEAIAAAEPREARIDRLTDNRMRAEHPELIADPAAMRAEAVKAVHNDSRAQMLRLELEHLASENMAVLKDVVRRVTRRMPPEQIVRDQANRIVGEQKVENIRPDAYERAERKAAKEAGEALAKGDLEAAFAAKRRELLNHELFRAATAARETIRKSMQDFRRLAKKDEDLAKSRDMDLVNTARAILARFNLMRPTDKPPEAYLEAIHRYNPDTYEAMRQLYDSATQVTGSWREVPFDDFVAMRDAVMAMWSLARETKTMEIDGRKVDIEKVTDELNARIATMAPKEKAAYTETASDGDRRWTSWLGIKASLRRVESWVTAMDGAEKGIFRTYIWNPVSEAAGQYREYKKGFLEQYVTLVKGIEKSLSWEPIAAPEIGHQFRNKGELLGALLHVGNASNKQKLLRGWGWGEADVEGNLVTTKWDAFRARAEAEGIITKADWDFVQGVWDLYEKMKPDAQRVHKKLYGYYFNEITAEPVKTSYGEYRGGYAPAIADPDLVEDASLREQQEALEKSNNSFMFPTAGRGFTKNRSEAYAAKLAIDLRYIPMQIDRVSRFVHLEPAVKQVSRIVMNRSFREALSTVDKAVAGDMLVPWLQRSAQQKVVHPSQSVGGKWLDRALRSVRGRAGMQIMFSNVTNAMQQLTGLSIAAVKVAPSHLRSALWAYAKSPSQTVDEITEKSVFMRNKLTTQTTDMLSGVDEILLNPSPQERALEFAKKHAYWLQSAFQNVVDNVTWAGAYEQAVQNGESEIEAVRSADSAVRATQGSLAAEDVARFETGTPLQRVFTQFYSYFNMLANLQGTEFSMAKELGIRKGAGRMLYVTALSLTIPAVLSELIVRAMSGKGVDEDDDDQYLTDVLNIFFGSQLRQTTAMVPIAGAIANAGFNRFNNKWYDDRISTSPAIALIESAVGSPASVYKAISGTGSKKVAVRDALTAIGMLSGAPVAPLAKPIGYLLDVNEGKAQPKGAIDFARGLVTGRSGAPGR